MTDQIHIKENYNFRIATNFLIFIICELD